MWKAVLPAVIALVTLGLSLVSGEVVKRDGEHKQQIALAQTAKPEKTPAPLTTGTIPPQTQAPAGRAVALVMGNASYPDAGLPLSQPVNNARALAAALKDKGFEVEFGENLTKQAMEHAFETFKTRIEPGSTALIFFSGIGVQAGRQTYMMPINAHVWSEADVRRAGVSLEPMLSEVDAKGAGAKLVILDASRRNPFERRFRSVSAGLAAVQAPDDTLVMYAAAPGKVVADGEGDVSPFMDELVGQIRGSGESVEAVFKRTQQAVSHASNRGQVPWVSSSLVDDVPLAAAAKTQQSSAQ